MYKIYCISFSCMRDFNKAICITVESYYKIDCDNFILEFDSEREREDFMYLLNEKEIEIDIFESENINWI